MQYVRTCKVCFELKINLRKNKKLNCKCNCFTLEDMIDMMGSFCNSTYYNIPSKGNNSRKQIHRKDNSDL
jgi:hypothetical protein